MILNLDLPYKKLPQDVKDAAQLTSVIIKQLVTLKYKDSMPRTESKMWAKIQDALDEDSAKIEIDGSQFDFLCELVEKTDMPPHFSSWLWVLREYFENEKKSPPDKLKVAK